MIVANTQKTTCKRCNEVITLYEYKGLEGGWYSDHRCAIKEQDEVSQTWR